MVVFWFSFLFGLGALFGGGFLLFVLGVLWCFFFNKLMPSFAVQAPCTDGLTGPNPKFA